MVTCDVIITTPQGVILMYDITSQATFSDIDRWLNTIREVSVLMCMSVCVGVYVSVHARVCVMPHRYCFFLAL